MDANVDEEILQKMRIIAPAHSEQVHQLKFGVQIKNVRRDVFFRSICNTKLQGNFEAYLSGVILPCMKAGGGTLFAEGEVSKKFLRGLEVIQDIHHSWDTKLEQVAVKCESSATKEPIKKGRVGAFFSGGLDSFYTLLKRQDTITDLIFVHGTDIKLDDTKLREAAATKIHEVALHFGKNLIEIETNISPFLASFGIPWGGKGHGAALATIAHILSLNLREIYIPSTLSYAQMIPWGSHPLMDPLWSSESLEFIHDGAEATRLDKVALVSKNTMALNCLRVCWQNVNSCYNCCKCEKCVQTMISLKIHNALDRCTTFNNEICIKDVYGINLKYGLPTRMHVQANLAALEKTQGNEELKRAQRRILNRPEWVNKFKDRISEIKDMRKKPKKMVLAILRIILPALLVNYLRQVRSWLNNHFPTRY